MKLKLCVLILLLLLFACSESGLPSGLRAGGFSLADQGAREEVIERMSEAGIAFKVEADGTIRFMQKDVAEVRHIKRGVLNDGKVNPNNIESEVAVNKMHLNLYETEFKKADIPYTVKDMGGYYNISWRVVHANAVDQIVEDIGFEFNDVREVN